MDLYTYLKGLSGQERDAFAKRCGTTKGHLQNVMYGLKSCGPVLAVQIERHSNRQVRRENLIPQWKDIWPADLPAPRA